ncbi:Nucleoprotein/polynucleotide-associated enzyme [Candidatus Electrothrix laxa]
MGNPLQDQLLKAGLVSKKQASKVKQEQYVQSKKKKGKSVRKNARKPISQAEVARAAEVVRNKEISRKQAEERQQREKQAQIKQLVMQNRVKLDEKNGQAYHFALGKKIHRIFVAEEMIDRLCQGQLGIVQLADSFEVVPAKVVRQVAERDKGAVISLREPSEEEDW